MIFCNLISIRHVSINLGRTDVISILSVNNSNNRFIDEASSIRYNDIQLLKSLDIQIESNIMTK